MLSWISANSGDIIVLLVLGLVVGAVIAAIKTRNGILAVTGVMIVLILSVFLPEIAACHNDKKKKD